MPASQTHSERLLLWNSKYSRPLQPILTLLLRFLPTSCILLQWMKARNWKIELGTRYVAKFYGAIKFSIFPRQWLVWWLRYCERQEEMTSPANHKFPAEPPKDWTNKDTNLIQKKRSILLMIDYHKSEFIFGKLTILEKLIRSTDQPRGLWDHSAFWLSLWWA